MTAWALEVRARQLGDLRHRVQQLVPWTSPTVVTDNGHPVLELDLAPVVSLRVSHRREGAWRIEVRPTIATPGSTLARRIDLTPAGDGETDRVADEVLAVCVEEWTRTAEAEDASLAMRSKAAEQLEALAHHRSWS